jgi:PAS domain S-box-containing protein
MKFGIGAKLGLLASMLIVATGGVVTLFIEIAHDYTTFLYAKIGVLLTGVLVAVFLSRRLTRPLERITEATRELAQGNFDVDLPLNASDEIGVLARCFKDMAEQIQANIASKREEEARLRVVLRTAAEGIFILDDQGRIQLLNQAAQRIFGYTDRELEGQNVKVLIPKEVQGLPIEGKMIDTPSAMESIRVGRINNSTQEAIGRRKDGTLFPLELSVSDVPIGKRRIYTGIVRDISERKRAEKEIRELNDHLRALNEQLDRRVRDRTQQLQHTNEELAVARDHALEGSRVKNLFLAQMSHELRTPLNAIKGYTEMVLEELEERGLRELAVDLKKVLTSERHLLAMIDDLLDFSKIEARRLELELTRFDVPGLIDEVAQGVRPELPVHGNELKVRCDGQAGTMYADRNRIRQVLLNLLENANKFTESGQIELEVERQLRPAGDSLLFRVRDSGIGIAPEQRAKLFKPFSQVDAETTRKYDGTGLGLAISRSFCLLMGGDIAVESEPGKGSTFTVRLPAEVTDGGVAETATTVLVIEEEQGNRDEMVRLLRQENYRCVAASNGLEGLRLARQVSPAAILLNVEPSGQGGWETLASLKTDPATSRIPVFVVTDAEERGLALAVGAADQLTRPLDRSQLTGILQRIKGEVLV